MPDLLVVYASKMGATEEIAEAIAQQARAAGLTVSVASATSAPAPGDYRGVVVGSAVYFGRWRRPATRYLLRNSRGLRTLPVWLFQDGPCGRGRVVDDPRVPNRVRRLADRIDADPPITFPGRLDAAHATGWISRWLARDPGCQGDFRDWAKIRDWARTIVAQLIPDRIPNRIPNCEERDAPEARR